MNSEKIEFLKEVEALAIKNIPISPGFMDFVHTVMFKVHHNGGKLIISGMGKAGHIANNMATTFSSTGTPAIFLHPAEAQHGDLGIIQSNDVLLVLSNSGQTREILELIDLARKLNPCLSVIAISSKTTNPIRDKVNIIIPTGDPAEICPLGLTPTTSTTVMTVIGDILIYLMMIQIGFTKEDYALRHHGGYLGKKARQ